MRCRESADAQQRHRHRNVGALRELAHERHRPGQQDAVAGEDDRPLGAVDQLERRLAIGLGDGRPRHADMAGVRRRLVPLELARGLLRVLGDVDQDRAGPALRRDGESLAHGARHVLGAGHEIVVLRDRQRDAGDVGFLERVRPDQPAADLAGDADDRRRVHHRRGDAGDHVGRAGARRRNRDADAAAGAGVAVGHVRRALLVPDQDVPDREVEHRVVGREDGAARISEHVGDALAHQTFPQNLRTGSFHIYSGDFVPRPPLHARSRGPCAPLRSRGSWRFAPLAALHSQPTARRSVRLRARSLARFAVSRRAGPSSPQPLRSLAALALPSHRGAGASNPEP